MAAPSAPDLVPIVSVIVSGVITVGTVVVTTVGNARMQTKAARAAKDQRDDERAAAINQVEAEAFRTRVTARTDAIRAVTKLEQDLVFMGQEGGFNPAIVLNWRRAVADVMLLLDPAETEIQATLLVRLAKGHANVFPGWWYPWALVWSKNPYRYFTLQDEPDGGGGFRTLAVGHDRTSRS